MSINNEELLLVSVVIATYRRERSLKKAIESLIEQTYKNIEIIVVDDNADEIWNNKVKDIIALFLGDKRIFYIKNKENLGSANTRNIGIDMAKGKYITFLDDDDIYLPNKIKKQLEFMEREKLDYSITDLDLFDKNEKLVNKRIRSYIKENSHQALLTYHLKYHLTGTDTLMYKRDYLIKIGKFTSIDVGDEYYLMQKSIDNNGKFGYLPGCEVKAYIHIGEEGLSSGDRKIVGENMLYEYKKEFFKFLNFKDIRYIKTRHYAVIAYAEIRRKNYFKFFINVGKAFFSSPKDFFLIIK